MGPVILCMLIVHDSDFKVMPRNFMSCTGIFGVLVSFLCNVHHASEKIQVFVF